MKTKRWTALLAAMPRLSAEQATALLEILDYHLGSLSHDYPKVDEAHYLIQQDVAELGATTAKEG